MSVKKNFFFNLLLNISNIIFPVLTIPYITRVLGVENFGHFNFVTTFVTYFTLLAGLGIPYYGTREIAKVQQSPVARNQLFAQIFTINSVASLLSYTVYLLCVFFIPKLTDSLPFFLVAGFGVLFACLNLDWLYGGLENFRFIAIRSLLVKIVSLVFLFVFVTEQSDLLTYVAIYTFATIGNHFLSLRGIKKYGFRIRPTLQGLKIHFKPLVMLMCSGIAIQVYLLVDTIILGFMRDYTEVGLYSSAIKVIRLVMPVISSFGIVLLPKLASLRIQDTAASLSLLSKSFSLLNFISIPASVYFFFIAERFVPFFLGVDFEGAIAPMKIMAALIFIGSLSNFFSIQTLVVFHQERQFFISVFLGMIANILGNIFFISLWGIIGAAIASVASEIIVTLSAMYFTKKTVHLNLDYKFIGQIGMCSLSFVGAYLILGFMRCDNLSFLALYTIISWIGYLFMQYIFKAWVIQELLEKLKLWQIPAKL